MRLIALSARAMSEDSYDNEAYREASEKTGVTRRVAQRLEIGATRLAALLKTTPYESARILAGQGSLEVGTVEFRNALRLVRLAAVLNVIFKDDKAGAVAWLDTFEAEFEATPWSVMVSSEAGFEDVIEAATTSARSLSVPSPH